MSATTITLTELLAEMERAARKNTEGQTLRELVEATRLPIAKLKATIRAGIANGTIACSRAFRPAIDGTMRPVPVYRSVSTKKPKGK